MKVEKKYPIHFHHGHSVDEIRRRLSQRRSPSYLRDLVYGAIDGAVTTFAVVSGVVGANLESKTILILGFANLIADGFSMAAGNYLGTKTELQECQLLEDFEHKQVSINPEGEEEEVKQILSSQGFSGDLLERATKLFVEDRKRWVDLMLKEEYGLASSIRSPLKAGASTFLAFICFGLIPLLPFLLSLENSFSIACTLTGVAFFLIGTLKSRWTIETIWISGVKTLAIGTGAAILAYLVGSFLKEMA